jgi:hypothetical protein
MISDNNIEFSVDTVHCNHKVKGCDLSPTDRERLFLSTGCGFPATKPLASAFGCGVFAARSRGPRSHVRSGSDAPLSILTMTGVLGLSVCACAPTYYAPSISPDDRIAPEYAYIYGRFMATSMSMTGQHPRPTEMGFAIACKDDKQYAIHFSVDAPLQVIKISPSTCWLAWVFFQDKTDDLPNLAWNVKFEAGKAYYIGDFRGAVVESLGYGYGFKLTQWHASIPYAEDRYRVTTGDMISAFPNLARVPTENRVIRSD